MAAVYACSAPASSPSSSSPRASVELGDAELSRDGGIGQQCDRVAGDFHGQLGVAALERQPGLVDFQVALQHRAQAIAVERAGRGQVLGRLLGVADGEQDVRQAEVAQGLGPLVAGLLVEPKRTSGVVGRQLVVAGGVVQPREGVVDTRGDLAVELVAAVSQYSGQQLGGLGVAARVGLGHAQGDAVAGDRGQVVGMLFAQPLEQRLQQLDRGVSVAGAGEQPRDLEVQVGALGRVGVVGIFERFPQQIERVLFSPAPDGDLSQRLQGDACRVAIARSLGVSQVPPQHLIGFVVALECDQ